MSETPHLHQWRFFRSGGFDQVELETGDDLRNLAYLDPKLWTVLNCPTTGLEFDTRTAALLDANGDGQIRVPEVLAAVEWVCARLVDADLMFAAPGVPASAISDQDADGQALKAAALRALQYVGKNSEDQLEVSDLLDMTRLFSPNHFNGDGVITAHLTDDEGLQTLINEIRDTQGSLQDRSGEEGINADHIDAFYKQLEELLAWQKITETKDEKLYPLGAETATAAGIVDTLEEKVNDYFVRCRLASYDERASDHLNPAVATYDTLSDRSLVPADTDVKAMPLATIIAGRPLPLSDGVNPGWAALVAQLRDKVVSPMLGEETGLSDKNELTNEDWQTILARLAPYREWLAKRPDSRLLELASERLAAIKAQDRRKELLSLVDEDLAAKSFADTVDDVERLVRYQRDLVTFLQNFVTLSDFYRGIRKAIFQIGTLYIDQRSCELVLRVDSVDRHAAMAPFSGCYLVYCTCERQGESPLNIVAALTGGSVNELMVPGRNGVYYDRQGRDWKATVTRVVEQPVSLRQAFWSPYQRAAAFVEAQLHKFAASRDENLGTAAADAPAQAFDIARFAGIFAAIGLAIGAIGTALAAALAALFSLQWWQIPLVFIGLVVVISGPSVLMAYLTLRNRNLGPLLDANGWAVNTRARINVPFGAALTGVAELPAGSKRRLRDPYADRQKPWKAWVFFGAVAAAGVAIWYWLWPLI